MKWMTIILRLVQTTAAPSTSEVATFLWNPMLILVLQTAAETTLGQGWQLNVPQHQTIAITKYR
jgi:hypothetical protein